MTPTNQPGSVQATLNALQADLAKERAYSAGLERELAEAKARVREMEKAAVATLPVPR